MMYTSYQIDVEGHLLDAQGFNLHLDSPALVFLHGITGSNAQWRYGGDAPYLARFRWYTLGLPGHFPSIAPLGFTAAEVNAATLARVMGQAVRELVGQRPVVLIGHSTGGFAALNIAANARTSVNLMGVVSVAGFAQGRWAGSLGLLQRFARLGAVGRFLFEASLQFVTLHPWVFGLSVLTSFVRDWRGYVSHPALQQSAFEAYHDARQQDRRAIMAYFQAMPYVDIVADLCRIDVPALVIAGDRDPIVPPTQAALIARQIQGAEQVMMPGVGHLPQGERGEHFDKLMAGWLARHVTATS